MFRYYDIGVNLFCEQFHDPEQILSDAAEAGVGCILTGSSMSENRQIDAFVRTHEAWGTCGIHPHGASRMRPEDLGEMERILTENDRVLAVGECGLDYDRMFSPMDVQRQVLEAHIALAERLGKPMFLHEREAAADMTAIFREHPDVCRRSVIHCFTGGRETLETYLEMGFMIGITGWICDDRRAAALRVAVAVLPPDRLMIETDCPYLTPRGIKGLRHTNVPGNVRYVAQALAKWCGMEEDALVRSARENTLRFFGISV